MIRGSPARRRPRSPRPRFAHRRPLLHPGIPRTAPRVRLITQAIHGQGHRCLALFTLSLPLVSLRDHETSVRGPRTGHPDQKRDRDRAAVCRGRAGKAALAHPRRGLWLSRPVAKAAVSGQPHVAAGQIPMAASAGESRRIPDALVLRAVCSRHALSAGTAVSGFVSLERYCWVTAGADVRRCGRSGLRGGASAAAIGAIACRHRSVTLASWRSEPANRQAAAPGCDGRWRRQPRRSAEGRGPSPPARAAEDPSRLCGTVLPLRSACPRQAVVPLQRSPARRAECCGARRGQHAGVLAAGWLIFPCGLLTYMWKHRIPAGPPRTYHASDRLTASSTANQAAATPMSRASHR